MQPSEFFRLFSLFCVSKMSLMGLLYPFATDKALYWKDKAKSTHYGL